MDNGAAPGDVPPPEQARVQGVSTVARTASEQLPLRRHQLSPGSGGGGGCSEHGLLPGEGNATQDEEGTLFCCLKPSHGLPHP